MCVCVLVCVCVCVCVCVIYNMDIFTSCAAKRQIVLVYFGIHEQETVLHVAYTLLPNSKFYLLKEIRMLI